MMSKQIGVDLISDVLPFGRLWYGEPDAVSNAIGYTKHRSRSHDAVIRVYNAAVSQQNDNRNRDAVNRCPALARRKTFLSSMGSEDQTGATAVKRLAIRKILGTKTVREITLK
jgi:hypothetical protein